MERIEEKRQALASALAKTDALLDDFKAVLKQDFGPSSEPLRDFSYVAEKIIPDEEPFSEPEAQAVKAPDDERLHMSYQDLCSDAMGCTRCQLCKTRTNVVFGTGCTDRPVVMVIGEGPGENEDLQGLPFVGRPESTWTAGSRPSRFPGTPTSTLPIPSSADPLRTAIPIPMRKAPALHTSNSR